MKNSLVVIFGILAPAILLAADGQGGPFPTVYYQLFNVSLVLIGIGFFTRSAIIQHFKSRREEYLAMAEKTQRMKKDAEMKLKEIEQRLRLLEKTKEDSIEKAKAEALLLKQKMIQDAEELATRLKREAQAAATAEVQRAKQALLLKMTTQALEEAKQILSKDISGADQGRLQEGLVQQL